MIPEIRDNVITKIIITLPPNYHPLISVWNSIDEDMKTVEKLTRNFQQEETLQLATKEFTQDNSDSAFFAKRNSRFKIQRGGNPIRQRNDRTDRQAPVSGFNRNLRLQWAFCRKDNRKSTHKEEDCWRKEADMQGRRDAKKEMGILAIGETTHQSSHDQDYAFQSTPENGHSTDDDAWFADLGASQHITNKMEFFKNFTTIKHGDKPIKTADDQILQAVGFGDIKIRTRVEGNWALATLEDVLYVPGLSTNLFSIGAVVDHGIKVTFISTGLTLINRADGKVIAIGHRAHQKLNRMDMESILPESMAYGLGASTSNSLQVWHQRLGHINNGTILKMIRLQAVDGLTINNSSATPFCEGCIMGKHHRLPFPT